MSINIKEAYPRIDEALACGKTVFLTDGTVTAQVTKCFGDADDSAVKWMTLAMGENYSAKSFEVNDLGELEGISLRDTKDFLIVGPDWYLAEWPCDCPECIALFGKLCSVANCRGPVCGISKDGINSADDAAKAYLDALPQEKCFMPEHGNAYPLCVGNGAEVCKTCCVYKDMESRET